MLLQLRSGAPVSRATRATTSSLLRVTRTSQPLWQDTLDVRIPCQQRALYHSSDRRSSAFGAAVAVAKNVVSNAMSRSKPNDMTIDPLRLVAKEMKFLTGNIRNLLGSGHPSLDRAAKYYTQAEGKHMRPLIVLLMSRATYLCPKAAIPPPNQQDPSPIQSIPIDSSISPLSILRDANPSSASTTASLPRSAETDATAETDILPSQRRLAEITELIHTASLLHDDVIDHSVSRRGAPSANLEFGNKMAVLAGDFLLGRASVVELLATVIANLVEGEFMQLKNTAHDEARPQWSEDTLGYYLNKTYLKTASLISKSCRAAALLGGASAETVEASYAYGKNLGLAFQLVDDMLDYTRSAADLGKPAGADLELGLATAPLLFAWKTRPELGELVGRKFAGEGDVARARQLVLETDGIEQTRALAEDYAEKAIQAISAFPESEAKDGLVEMAVKTIQRRK
ncbi:putative hexaprenyl pyrophosphate synthase, mitochondrial [Cytospora mali]|uniref:Hexaprenyl pyrophosphate synthase, mitochondrial n=1 Tax=Cytospora mali TaxID=578113 RepID=A0A194VCC0_CYTMA|nr:putative hexaprenyl pyrophosphate synthase, mitochondrial [Valsa mali var. pyri (nom. inval.)]